MESLNAFHEQLVARPWLFTLTSSVALLLLAWLADQLTQRLLLRVLVRLVKASSVKWDDAILHQQ